MSTAHVAAQSHETDGRSTRGNRDLLATFPPPPPPKAPSMSGAHGLLEELVHGSARLPIARLPERRVPRAASSLLQDSLSYGASETIPTQRRALRSWLAAPLLTASTRASPPSTSPTRPHFCLPRPLCASPLLLPHPLPFPQVTTDSIKFKAKSWIDVFGGRASKAIGSVVTNTFKKPVTNLMFYGSLVSIGIAFSLILITSVLGRAFERFSASGELVGMVRQATECGGARGRALGCAGHRSSEPSGPH